MKIVVVSLAFLPAVGGLENIMAGLADEWSIENEVTVFTNNSNSENDKSYPYSIIRKFSIFSLCKAVSNADILIEANVSLATCLVGIFNWKKWFIIHHGIYDQSGILGSLKRLVTKATNNIAVSKYVAENIPAKCIIIPNFYNSKFRVTEEENRINDIVFLGRLVSDKGVDLLLDALSILKSRKVNYRLNIIGIGPEESNLKKKIDELNLNNSVTFLGIIKGEDLVQELNKYQVMVVPSKWKEPFGIVALEGLACGCKVIVPNEGGLKEAVGNFGYLYKHNNVESLAETIQLAFAEQTEIKEVPLKHFLQQHQSKNIAANYISHFSKIISR